MPPAEGLPARGTHERIAGYGEGIRHQHHSRAASRRSLAIAMALVSAYMLVEVVAGVVANSLALLADAGHMLTDAAAIGLALLAMWLAGGLPPSTGLSGSIGRRYWQLSSTP